MARRRFVREGPGRFRDPETGDRVEAAALRRLLLDGEDLVVTDPEGDDRTLATIGEFIVAGTAASEGGPSSWVASLGRAVGQSPLGRWVQLRERVEELAKPEPIEVTSVPLRSDLGPPGEGWGRIGARVSASREGPRRVFGAERRVAAPIEMVWDEITDLERVLETMPGIVEMEGRPEVTDDGQLSVVEFTLEYGRGAQRARVPMEAEISLMREPSHFYFLAACEDLGVRVEGRIELEPLGASDTNLSYQAILIVDHHATGPDSPAVRQFSVALEDHVRIAINQAAGQAERVNAAQRNLGGRRRRR